MASEAVAKIQPGREQRVHVRRIQASIAVAVLAVAVACTTSIPADQAPTSNSVASVVGSAHSPAAAEFRGDYAPLAAQPGFVSAYRRLTESQYRHAIADTFGPDIIINARFEPERREDGLQAVGSAQLSVTTTGLEQYLAVARSVADQVVDEKRRDKLVGCSSVSPGPAADACAETFLKRAGLQLFRRPLSATEIAGFKSVWKNAADKSGDFNKAISLSLVSLLMSPEFLFRVERAEADPASSGAYRLDSYSKATRLSFTLWDAPPDAELATIARSGAIHDPAVMSKQIDRMLASPRLEAGVRAFFTDMLQFETFDTLSKDAATYPNFSQTVADSAREETLKFLVDHLVTRAADYRDIFTSPDTVLNRPLASVYDVPYPSAEPWARFTFPEKSERAGVLTQVTFLSLFAHPGSSSPTIRGVKLNEIFTCVAIPQPPPDVDFSKVQALEKGTVRTRLIDHMTNPGCSSCHLISDPPGLALERFDGLGQFRTMENGAPIDVAADIAGKKFNGSVGLGQYMHDHPGVPGCAVRRISAYGAGHSYGPDRANGLAERTSAFAASGYRWAPLLRGVLTDPQFYNVTPPEGARVQTAEVSSGEGL
jgi:hypothetical protein